VPIETYQEKIIPINSDESVFTETLPALGLALNYSGEHAVSFSTRSDQNASSDIDLAGRIGFRLDPVACIDRGRNNFVPIR
jgi:hypothetical protein